MTLLFRPETPADEPFLCNLIVETVALELGATAWPEPMRSQLLGTQYAGRMQSRAANFPRRESCILQADGVDAGWLLVNESADELRLIEIMVLPDLRGRGIGTVAIRHVQARATSVGKPLRLHVNVMNPGALRLYERLGFRRIAGDEVQDFMESAG